MARLIYTDAFIEAMLGVEQQGKRDEILGKVDLLTAFPDIGSANVPDSTRMQYGGSIRKLVVRPFDVVYEHDAESDTVAVLGLVHQRAAW